MATNDLESKKQQFLLFLNQPDSCEQFYLYMKAEELAYVLEFYLACDGLKNLLDDPSKQGAIIELIYKHYLTSGKDLSSKRKFHLPEEILQSIQQRLTKKEFHRKFYEQAQEFVLKHMLIVSYPKFLQTRSKKKEANETLQSRYVRASCIRFTADVLTVEHPHLFVLFSLFPLRRSRPTPTLLRLVQTSKESLRFDRSNF